MAGLWGCSPRSETTRERDTPARVRSGADWLRIHPESGRILGPSADPKDPLAGSPPPFSSSGTLLNGSETQRQRAVAWLLKQEGRTSLGRFRPRPRPRPRRHTRGLALVADTHHGWNPRRWRFWPSAGKANRRHHRVGEGVHLIADHPGRRLKSAEQVRVRQRPRVPNPAPPALALPALKAASGPSNVVENGDRLPLADPPGHPAPPASLSWGVLALRAWDRAPAESADWLAESYASRRAARRRNATGTLLLLAGADASLPLLLGHVNGRPPWINPELGNVATF